MSQFFRQQGPVSTGRDPYASTTSEPLDDDDTTAPSAASSSSSSSSSSPLPQSNFVGGEEKTNTFRLHWTGTIDEIAGDPTLAIAKLVYSDDVIGATHGILMYGSVKLTNSSFPVDLLISSNQFKPSVVSSSKDGLLQRGVVIAHPGLHLHGKEHTDLVPHKKETNEKISKSFLHYTQADIDRGLSFVYNQQKQPTHAELEQSNPLWKIIQANHVKDGRIAYCVDPHTDPEKRRNNGIRVVYAVYKEACKCFMENVAPHLIKQAFSDIEFKIERAGAKWEDPLLPPLEDPRYRTTPFEISAEVTLCYQLLEPK